MRILSVYYGHDASCTLLEDGKPVTVLEKERLTRTKHEVVRRVGFVCRISHAYS